MDKPFLTVKVISDETFSCHEGFDFASFDEQSQPSKSTPVCFHVPKAETYASFKLRVSQHFHISLPNFRLWVFANHQSKTIRPNVCIDGIDSDIVHIPIYSETKLIYGMEDIGDHILTAMEEIRYNMGARGHDLHLYVEQIPSLMEPERLDSTILVFLKHFIPTEQSILGIGSVRVSPASKVVNLVSAINERMHWELRTVLKLYRENEPGVIELLEPMLTCAQSEIQDGDIIWFEVAEMRSSVPQEADLNHYRTEYLPISNIEDSITCLICTEKLWTPYMLPECGHTMCQGCLEKWFDTVAEAQRYAPQYTCPHCREHIFNRPVEVFALKAIVQAVAKVQHETIPPESGLKQDPWAKFFKKR